MAFKQVEKKKMSKGMIAGIVIVIVLLGGMCAWSVWNNGRIAAEQQAQEEAENTGTTQEAEVVTEDVSEFTDAQSGAKMEETQDSQEFWTLICGSKWNDTSTGSVLEFNQEKSYFKEEIAKNNNKHVDVFVLCKFEKTSNALKDGNVEVSYKATCMNGKNKLFDLQLLVTKERSGDTEKISSLVITSDGFSLGSYYTRIVSSENFQVTGLDTAKLQAFGVDTDTLTQKVKEYCSVNLPSITKLDFINAKITGFMNQNYVILSVVPSGTRSSSSKTIYIMCMNDTGEVTVSENSSAISG